MDSKKVFLDTNVVLNMLDDSRPNSDSIKALSKKLIVDQSIKSFIIAASK